MREKERERERKRWNKLVDIVSGAEDITSCSGYLVAKEKWAKY